MAGDGLAHVYAEKGRIRFERVLATELWVDEQEAIYGYPRQMHRTKLVDRFVIRETVRRWLKDETKARQSEVEGWINAAETSKPDLGTKNDLSDLIEVRESWHLPSGEGAGDGLHVISIAGHVLMSEPWERDHFPFARFRWCPRMVGFWSQGGVEQAQRLQFQLNKLWGVVDRSFELGGTFTWLLENSAKVPIEHMSNKIGKIIKYNGPNKPEVITPTLVQAEIFQRALQLKADIYEQFGISQLSASSQKPAGLNSGVALREYEDIESDRFQTIGHAYEQFFLDLAQLTIEAAEEMGGNFTVNAPGKRTIEPVDLREAKLPRDKYVMQCFPVSSLPRDPAGRLQTIQEYMQAGLITPRQGKRLLDFPDLDHLEDFANAPEDWITESLDGMLDGGDFVSPEPEDDLQLARELTLEYLAHAKSQKVEDDRLEMLRRYLGKVDELQKAAAALAVAQQPGATPQVPPQPPPKSELVPNQQGLQQQATA